MISWARYNYKAGPVWPAGLDFDTCSVRAAWLLEMRWLDNQSIVCRDILKAPRVRAAFAHGNMNFIYFTIFLQLWKTLNCRCTMSLWGETSANKRFNLWSRSQCVFSSNRLQFQLPHPAFLRSWRDIWSTLKRWGYRIFPELSAGWVAFSVHALQQHTHTSPVRSTRIAMSFPLSLSLWTPKKFEKTQDQCFFVWRW